VSKPKKRTKKYNPRAVDRNACITAITRAKILREPVNDDFAGALEIIVLSALDTVMRGYGTRSEWDSIANALNQSWLLCSGGVGTEGVPVLEAAQEAMKRAAPGVGVTGKLEFASEADLHLVEEGLSIWSQQIRMVNIGELDAATRLVEKHYWDTPEKRAA
jgi:hypothetical protein